MTDSFRSMQGRIGAHESWAKTDDRSARTAPGRSAFLDRFEREVDPDGILAPAERAKRAQHARSAYMTRLAKKSATARQERSADRNASKRRSLDEDVLAMVRRAGRNGASLRELRDAFRLAHAPDRHNIKLRTSIERLTQQKRIAPFRAGVIKWKVTD